MILTYIINLKKDVERKQYMIKLLEPFQDLLSSHFIEAVEGKKVDINDLNKLFDFHSSYKRYGRDLNLGEVGCTLSHYKCYKSLLESDSNYALILEDDITLLGDFNDITNLCKIVDHNNPMILLLSGDYWYNNLSSKDKLSLKIASVYDAVGSYAYIINKAAAKKILSKNIKACNVADSWSYYKSLGIELKAVYPYMIDANIENFESSIIQETFGEKRRNMSFLLMLQAYWLALNKKILLKLGHFVSKIRR